MATAAEKPSGRRCASTGNPSANDVRYGHPLLQASRPVAAGKGPNLRGRIEMVSPGDFTPAAMSCFASILGAQLRVRRAGRRTLGNAALQGGTPQVPHTIAHS